MYGRATIKVAHAKVTDQLEKERKPGVYVPANVFVVVVVVVVVVLVVVLVGGGGGVFF